jgi:hypothetical protein
MIVKDIINKISGIVTLGMLLFIVLGYVTENQALLGIPNAMLLYITMPAGLIWFGTRKNGCGSCNQACSVVDQEKDN